MNNINAWITDYGSLYRNPITGNSGFEWPAGSNIYAIYAAGLWMGAQVEDQPRVAVAEYSYVCTCGERCEYIVYQKTCQ